MHWFLLLTFGVYHTGLTSINETFDDSTACVNAAQATAQNILKSGEYNFIATRNEAGVSWSCVPEKSSMGNIIIGSEHN